MARHAFACPLRWSDVDAFGHVNNVVYLTYLEEARVALLADTKTEAFLDTGIVVSRHEIDYRAPLVPRSGVVQIETWLRRLGHAAFTVGYEVFEGEGEGRTTYAVASTNCVPYDFAGEHPRRLTAEEREALAPYVEADGLTPRRDSIDAHAPGEEYLYPTIVRWADLDKYNHVNNVTFAEYLQEARIHFVNTQAAGSREPHQGMVLVHQQIDYRRPLLYRPEPITVALRVAHIGRTSYSLHYEVRDQEQVYATATSVQVGYDLRTQAPRPLSEGERRALERFAGLPARELA